MSTPTQARTTSTSSLPLVAELRRAVRGDVHGPGEPGYDAARTPWNLAALQRPAAVVVPRDAQDVAATLRAAAAAGVRVAPLGPGHGAAGLGPLDEAVLLRTGALQGVEVDAAARTARVGAGAALGELVAAAAPHGLAPVSGSSGGVSAVGFALGGGIGWLSRRLGLAASHVLALDVVLADGERVRATADREPDLFWALRGGGGTFGVVTAMEVALHPVPVVTAGAMVWPIERAPEVLRTWRTWTQDVPESVTASARLFRFPPLPQVPDVLRGRQVVIVDGAITGEPRWAEAELEPLLALGPELDTWVAAGPEVLPQVHGDPKDPMPGREGHVLLEDLDDRALGGLLDVAGPGARTSLTFAELRHLGGALGRPAPGGGALDRIAGAYALFGVGTPLGPAADAVPADLAALEAVGEHQFAGRFPNFAAQGAVEEMFPPAVLERLRAIKRAVDPEDRIQAGRPVT